MENTCLLSGSVSVEGAHVVNKGPSCETFKSVYSRIYPFSEYLDGIEKTWVAAAKIQEELGIISGYNVYVGNDGSTVYLALNYPSWANKGPWSDDQIASFQEKYRAIISEDDGTALSQGYEDIREIVSVELIGRLVFN